MADNIPAWYQKMIKDYPQYMEAVQSLGEAVRKEGPLDGKSAHLIQLAAAVAIRSEGSVHSHARRAMEAGASPEEVKHAIILLTSTLGFPTTSAALTWVQDILG